MVGGSERDRELAAKLGANVLDEEFPHRAGFYPITVDASADPDGIACVLRSTDADGYSTSIGIYLRRRRSPCSTCSLRGSLSSQAVRTCAP